MKTQPLKGACYGMSYASIAATPKRIPVAQLPGK